MSSHLKFAFFGTDEFAVTVLNTLSLKGLVPAIIITTPDKPKGRHLTLTPPPVKIWAEERNVSTIQPDKLKNQELIDSLKKENLDLFVVASYGKIIPKEIFDLPKYKTLNIHPSLLPLLRGASPVSTAILEDMKDTGVTIIQIDEKMDHGPIVAQKEIHINEWPEKSDLERKLATLGANLLAEIIPDWIQNKIKAIPQEEKLATYTKMIEKEDAEINLTDDPYLNFRKIQAYEDWPTAYMFIETPDKHLRVKIKSARFENGALIIESVLPEGKKEMSYEDFLRGHKII